jgi:putative flippase GtrA
MSLVRRLARYALVSVISTTVSLTILGSLVATSAVSAGWANVIATGVGTIPSFELNRRWVWRYSQRRALLAQVLPFCALSFLGLGLSTLAVSAATGWATTMGAGATGRALVAQAANVGTFGALWVAQFVLLDRVLFARPMPTGVDASTRRDVSGRRHPSPAGSAQAA